MCMYMPPPMHTQWFTILAVYFLVVDEKNLQQSEEIAVEFVHLLLFFNCVVDESSYTNKIYNKIPYSKDGDNQV